MMNSHVLTVAIPVYRALEYLIRCVKGVCNNTVVPFELLIVDNGNDDEARACISEVVRTVREKGLTIRVAVVPENRGFPYACNLAIDLATTPYLCILNSDTYPTDQWDVILLEAARQGDVTICGPSLNCCTTVQVVKAEIEGEVTDEKIEQFAKGWVESNDEPYRDIGTVHGSCMFIHQGLATNVGYFDERFGLGFAEENDYCNRAQKAGFRVVYARRAFVYHFGNRSFAESGIDVQALRQKNTGPYADKRDGRITGEVVSPKDDIVVW